MPSSDITLVCVYRSLRKAETYLYVSHAEGFARVPEALFKDFGYPDHTQRVMLLKMTPEKKLARTDGRKVLEQLDETGFYLQLPPPDEPLDPSEGRPLPGH